MSTFEIPNCDQLKAGVVAFEKNENRADVYFEALNYINYHWGTADEMAKGIKMLLDVWHLAFYRFGNFKFSLLVECIEHNLLPIDSFRKSAIADLSDQDEEKIKSLFNNFLDALRGGKRRSPVAIAKAIHLLAPEFFPLWDTDIAVAYGSWWVYSDFGALEYIPFCWKIKTVAKSVASCDCVFESSPKRSVLKLIDEYNYSKFTKGWI